QTSRRFGLYRAAHAGSAAIQQSSVCRPWAPPGAPDPGREILLTSGHIAGFTLLVLAWWWALRPSRHALLTAVIIALLLGTVTELLQTLVPDRSSSWFDLITNYVVTLGEALVIHKQRPTWTANKMPSDD